MTAQNSEVLRFPIRVKPGASRTSVGGSREGSLIVRVSARAVDGKATEAALRAVADALGLRRREVALVAGATSRDKVVEAQGDPQALSAAVRRLLAGCPPGSPLSGRGRGSSPRTLGPARGVEGDE